MQYFTLALLAGLAATLITYCSFVGMANSAESINYSLEQGETGTRQAEERVVYESPSFKVQECIPIILIGISALVTAGLVLLKKR